MGVVTRVNRFLAVRAAACRGTLVAAVALGVVCSAAAGPAGPANPLHGPGVVCVSQEGVTCFHAATGEVAWHALGGRQTLDLAPGPGAVLVAGSHGLQALAFADGGLRWRIDAFGSAFPAQSDGRRAWFGSRSGQVVMVDASTGRVLWSVDLGDWVYTPARVGGRLITGGRDARLSALDPATGTPLWQRPLGQELVYRPVAATDDSVLIGTFDGRVRRIAADTGRAVWTTRGATPAFRFAVADGRAFALRMGGTLEALDLASGRSLWSYRHPDASLTGLGVESGQVWVSDDAGRRLALDTVNGRLLGRRDLGHTLVGVPRLTPRGALAVTAAPLTLHFLGGLSAPQPQPEEIIDHEEQ